MALNSEFRKTITFLENEFGKLRGNRANPDLLSELMIEVYGTQMQLNQLATITLVDATLITVEPWDKNNTESIETTIRKSDLNVSPVVDKDVIKVPMPPLSQERREEFVKIAKKKAEEAKVSIRQTRHELISNTEAKEEKGDLTEDDLEQTKTEVQNEVDNANATIDRMLDEKQDELLKI
jgi:ribosome recycling factor